MRNKSILMSVLIGTALTIASCSKKTEGISDNPGSPGNSLSASEIALIKAAGLNESGATRVAEGYLIEGDILLSSEELNALAGDHGPELVIANTEHYRTSAVVTGLPRVIKVKYTGTRASISTALSNAVTRYNQRNLRVTFQKITSGTPNITISDVSGTSYIASAGFPSGGNPYNQVKFNTAYASWNANTLTTVITHELGHCIGFRHTDFMDRSYSCGGSRYDEGSAGVGAIHIPGTPTGPSAGSWMLACIGNGDNRPFTAADITALNYLY